MKNSSFSIRKINLKHELLADFRKARNHANRFPLWFIADTCHDLREVRHHPSVVSVLVDAAKNQGMRVHENNIFTDDAERINDHVMICRGKDAALVDLILESLIHRPAV